MKTFAIKNHCLDCATRHASPHFNQRPDLDDISLLVIHNISLPAGKFDTPYIHDLFMGTLDSNAHDSFADLQGLEVSAHCVIKRNGEIEQYVPFSNRAWHAGVSSYQGRTGCNDFSIGIELEGTDNIAYTEQQYVSLIGVAKSLIKQYPKITADRIVGHQHIAPGRKTDPGESFNWQYFFQLLKQK